jgi:hypothetical protein
MPNWCSNQIIFLGPNIDKVDKLFDELIKEQCESGLGVRPKWKSCEKYDARYMFSIDKTDNGCYTFETKWSPALDTVMLIGRKFNVSFDIHWDEPGMCLYGKATFSPNFKDVLTVRDASCVNFRYDDDLEAYIYNGKEYESEYDFIDDLIEGMTPSVINKSQILQT